MKLKERGRPDRPSSLKPTIYAPEIKFYETLYAVPSEMEATVSGFFVAGDASGHSHGIFFAAVNGVLAAVGIQCRLTVAFRFVQ